MAHQSACNAGDLGSITGSGRSPGEGNGSLLQYSCLENPMDRGDWQATVHGVTRVRYDFAFKHTTTEVKKFHVDEGNPHRHPLDLGAEFFYIFTYFYSI